MIRRLTPASSKCVAYECLSVCTGARFARPLRRTARRKALWRLLRVTGPPSCARLCARPRRVGAGKSQTGERCVRYTAKDVPSASADLWRGLEEALREDGSFLK